MAGIALLLASCSVAAPAGRASEPSRAVTESALPLEGSAISEFSISMRRGACFGRCPQYVVTIGGGGGVKFDGARFVSAVGSHFGSAEMAAVARLRSKANEVFATLGDVVPGAASCKNYATDHSQITLALRTADKTRTLRHYSGCASAPAELVELENLIDRTAKVDEWVSGRVLQ